MTTQDRIAAFLSTSALCLGLVAAPAAFAAPDAANAKTTAKAGHVDKHKAQAKHAKMTTSKPSVVPAGTGIKK